MKELDLPVSTQVLEQAIAWQLRLDSEAESLALAQWLAAHPEHARAWAQLEQIDQQLRAADVPQVRRALQRAPRRGARSKQALGLLLAIGAGLLALQQRPLPHWLADARTGAGEQRTLTLDDHSQVRLNSRSALDIQFDEQTRRLRLLAGEILVETAHGDPRPFIVATEQGDLRALGTRFLVRRSGDTTLLTVLQSAVEARLADSTQTRVVEQGRQLRLQPGRLGPSEPADASADAWSRGMLVVDDVPLAQLVEQLAEYHTGFIQLDERLAPLRISGSFPLHDRELALAALPASLPVRIERRSDWWIRILPAHP